jgi:phosphoribosylamine---glycine ligase
MKILVVGAGGREHALVWKLAQSPGGEKIWCAPGNGGTAAEAEGLPVDPGNVAGLVALAEKIRPDLTVVGPELPLVNGVADEFAQHKWPIVAPSRKAAQLEGSKLFAKEFLHRHRIPTAKMYGAYDSAKSAYAGLRGAGWPLVIKADGLCAGKGVFLASDERSAQDFVQRVMENQELGAGGGRVLFEHMVEGEELSFIIVTDGERYAPLVPTRDHKRAFDDNQGPNTGGMGAYSTDELLPGDLRETILHDVVEPTMRGLAADGIRYQGFLYFGLMLTSAGPKVLEFNCRLGDPEAQAIVARVNFDLAEVLSDVAAGSLNLEKFRWRPGASVCVVLASGGYPGKFQGEKKISGLSDAERQLGVKVLHAGTKRAGDSILTNGGRVLGVTATAASLQAALATAYHAIGKIHFDGMHYRKDIGRQASHLGAAGD